MKIALIGYGKMGKMIESIALDRGHEIVLTIDQDNAQDLNSENLSKADVAIEFSTPNSVLQNISACIQAKTPLIVGTTGWYGHLQKVKDECLVGNSSLMYGSNFSVGVNVFFELNKKLAQLMVGQTQYDIRIKEIHHTQKKDAPSGTAITLAEDLMANNPQKNKWVSEQSNAPDELVITSERIDPYPGLHEVSYQSEIDEIIISHNAHNRNGFALGAVLAAEYIHDKKGIFTMKDVLGFGN